MFDFAFSEEEDLVVDMATDFATRELRPAMRDHERAGRVSEAVAAAFDEAGLAEVGRPGSGTGPLTRARTLEALAWGDAGATLALMGPALTADVADALAAPAASGVHVVERVDGGSTPVDFVCASPVAELLVFDLGGRWRSGMADLRPARGVGLWAAGGAAGTVAAAAPMDAGEAAGADALAILHLATGAMLAGVARASLEYVAIYLRERRTFGKLLADHQGLAFLFADMAIATEVARVSVFAAASQGGAGRAAAARLMATDAAARVTDYGVQLLGGHGYMKAHPVEKWMRDARALSCAWGGRDGAVEVDARWT